MTRDTLIALGAILVLGVIGFAAVVVTAVRSFPLGYKKRR